MRTRNYNCRHVPGVLATRDRPAADRQLSGHDDSPLSCARWRASSISAAPSSSAGTSRRPSRSPSSRATPKRWARGAAVGQRRSGGRARRAPQGAVHRVAADGGARPARRRGAGRALRRGAGRRAARGRHHARLRAGARHPHQPEEPGHRRSRAGRDAPMVARLGAAIIARCRAKASRPAASTFPGTATRRVDSHLELPLVEHPPDRLRARRVRAVSAPRSRAGVAFIMTAHVLVPSLDEERPATLSPRIVQGMLREELGFEGVILSDDLEMKAIAADCRVPDAAVQAIAAGCDGLLICSGDVEVQARDARSPGQGRRERRDSGQATGRRVQAAARAKERFLAASRLRRPRPARRALRRCSGATSTRRLPTRWPRCDA